MKTSTPACEALCAAIMKHRHPNRSLKRSGSHCLTRAGSICGLATSAHSYAAQTAWQMTTILPQPWKC